jgi:hypothetical protein
MLCYGANFETWVVSVAPPLLFRSTVEPMWNVKNKRTGHWIRNNGFQSKEDTEKFLQWFLERYPPVGPLTEEYQVEEMRNEFGSRFDTFPPPTPATNRYFRRRKPRL